MFGSNAVSYKLLTGEMEKNIHELQDKLNELAKEGYMIRETKTFGVLNEKILIILYKD